MATATENIRGQVLHTLGRLTPVERVQVAAEILNVEGMTQWTLRVLLASLDLTAREALLDHAWQARGGPDLIHFVQSLAFEAQDAVSLAKNR